MTDSDRTTINVNSLELARVDREGRGEAMTMRSRSSRRCSSRFPFGILSCVVWDSHGTVHGMHGNEEKHTQLVHTHLWLTLVRIGRPRLHVFRSVSNLAEVWSSATQTGREWSSVRTSGPSLRSPGSSLFCRSRARRPPSISTLYSAKCRTRAAQDSHNVHCRGKLLEQCWPNCKTARNMHERYSATTPGHNVSPHPLPAVGSSFGVLCTL